MAAAPTIGRFIGLEAPSPTPSARTFESDDLLYLRNARAALAHLLASLERPRVWLPAYVCGDLAEGAATGGREVLFYPVGEALIPDADFLRKRLRPGDAVVGVDYFGAAPGDRALANLAAESPDLVWIQDRAQALWPDEAAWAQYLLYSPRKVIGVPDGGVLVSRRGPVAEPDWRQGEGVGHLLPAILRFEDPGDTRSEVWRAAYRAAEDAMTAEPFPMSRLARTLLPAIDVTAAIARRRRNAAVLEARVAGQGLFEAPRLSSGAPIGVPVLTSDAAAVQARMAEQGVFCPRHWPDLPSPPDAFGAEHQLSRRLLTLPCDHRYGEDDMARVADVFDACR